MRIEALDLQIPIICRVVLFDKFQAGIEGERLTVRALLAVRKILPNTFRILWVGCFRNLEGTIQAWFPGIAFLTTQKIPGRIFRMIILPTLFEVMVMIGDEMRVHLCLLT